MGSSFIPARDPEDAARIARVFGFYRSIPKNRIVHVRTNGELTFGSFLYCPRYVVLDFETTGLSPEKDKIIEVGMIRYNQGVEEEVFSALVNPMEPIPAKITKLTGITDEDVQSALPIDEIIGDIRKFIDGCPVVAHNAKFDVDFLRAAYKATGLPTDIAYVDTLEWSKKAFPKMKDHKLETLIKELGLSDGPQTHRALDDVRCTGKLLNKCVEILEKWEFV